MFSFFGIEKKYMFQNAENNLERDLFTGVENNYEIATVLASKRQNSN